jgi:hypothetical protein
MSIKQRMPFGEAIFIHPVLEGGELKESTVFTG